MKLLDQIKTIRRKVTESISSGMRISFASVRRSFWPVSSIGRVVVNMDKSRGMYRNTEAEINLSAGFVKRIINAVPEFMGLPHAASGDPDLDDQITTYIRDFWSREIQQAIRDACRDSRAIVRFRKHSSKNPLVDSEERDAGYLEIVPPEKCTIFYAVDDATMIERVLIEHEIEEVLEDFDITQNREPQTRVHQITEEITPTEFRYFDHTEGEEREDLNSHNEWGFCPIAEVFNEYESYLEGGQSDLEPVYTFLRAFHDVMAQTLTAHKYHSIPKAVFNINDVQTFLMNNYPDSYDQDDNGNPIAGTFNGSVSWKGTEILFMQPEEDVDFLEAQSVLGDSKTLLDFLLQCIAIASETPKSILMDQTAQDADEMIPLAKKINRKRKFFQPYLQQICKMVLAINHMEPLRVPLSWEEITPDMVVKKAEALQQTVMATEVLATRQVISDRTVREHIRPQIPSMKGSTQEQNDAKANTPIPGATGPVGTGSVTGTDAGNKKVGKVSE